MSNTLRNIDSIYRYILNKYMIMTGKWVQDTTNVTCSCATDITKRFCCCQCVRACETVLLFSMLCYVSLS